MKNLIERIDESLKTIERKKGYDVVQILDRKFKEGELVDNEIFKKAVIDDIKTCFSLPEDKLNKDYDKVIDMLVQEEINKKIKMIENWADKYYKTQARRDKYIQDSKDEIRNNIIKRYSKRSINRVNMQLNPLLDGETKGIVKDKSSVTWGDFVLSDKTADQLSEWFETFSYRDKNGQLHDMRPYVIGWTITYAAYERTECPKYNAASLNLKLTRTGEAIVKKFNSGYGDMIAAYYASKGTGGYTGD